MRDDMWVLLQMVIVTLVFLFFVIGCADKRPCVAWEPRTVKRVESMRGTGVFIEIEQVVMMCTRREQ